MIKYNLQKEKNFGMSKFAIYDVNENEVTDGASQSVIKEPIFASFPARTPAFSELQKMNFTIS